MLATSLRPQSLYADDAWGPLFARLHQAAPVHYCHKSPYESHWSVTGYDDIMAVELDHAAFSSSYRAWWHPDRRSAARRSIRQLHSYGPAAPHRAAQNRGANRDFIAKELMANIGIAAKPRIALICRVAS
jgi:hypothetical protein